MKRLQTILLVGLLLISNSFLFAQNKGEKGGAADRSVIGKIRVDSIYVARPSTGAVDSAIGVRVHYNAQGLPEYDTFGKCDEQYYSAIQLTLKREKAIPFTIAGNRKVEFSSGNLQYCQKTKTFRFADRQWYFCGDGGSDCYNPVRGVDRNSGMEVYDSVWVNRYIDCVRHVAKLNPDGTVLSAAGTQDSVVANDTSKLAYCTNLRVGDTQYQGWIDLFGWATSGMCRTKEYPNNLDPDNTCYLPYSAASTNSGFGPGYAKMGAGHQCIDTTCDPERYYDWGQYNDIYCKWVSYDTICDASGAFLRDTQVMDSTYFRARQYELHPGGVSILHKTPIWRTLTNAEWTGILSRQVFGVDKTKVKCWSRVKISFPDRDIAPDPTTGRKVYPNDDINKRHMIEGILLYPDGANLGSWMHTQDADPEGVIGETFQNRQNNFAFGNTTAFEVDIRDYFVLEKMGTVFLPLGGQRKGSGAGSLNTSVTQTSKICNYWSATTAAAGTAYSMQATTMTVVNVDQRNWGNAVRLVHDIEDPVNLTPSAYAKGNAAHRGLRNITKNRLP